VGPNLILVGAGSGKASGFTRIGVSLIKQRRWGILSSAGE